MEQPTLNLDLLPDEILLKILCHMLPEDIFSMLVTSKKYHDLLKDPVLWGTKFKRHFPYAYADAKLNHSDTWYQQFIDEYNSDYKNLSQEIKLLFSIVKEGKIERLKEYITVKKEEDEIKGLNHLAHVDANDISILEWIRINKNQPLLDYIYHRISLTDYDFSIKINETVQLPSKSIIWPILCRQATSEIISSIQSNQAAFNAVWLNGYQGIHFAAEDNRSDVIKELKASDVLIDAKSNENKTALHCAAEAGALEACETLLELGADINAKTSDGMTALHYTAAKGYDGIIEILLKNKKVNLDEYDVIGQTALTYSLIYNHSDTAKLLIKHKAKINNPTSMGLSSLHFVARMGNAQSIELAVRLGANINAIDNKGLNPLHHAANSGNYNGTAYLISQGVDVNTTDKEGFSSLHHAIYHRWIGDKSLLKLHSLLCRNPNRVKFSSAKTVAIILNQPKVKKNMRSGSPTKLRLHEWDLHNSTALDLAVITNNHETIALLIQAGVDFNIESCLSLYTARDSYYDIKGLQILLQYANDKNLPNTRLQEFLIFARNNGKKEVFKVLIIFSLERYISKLKQRDANAKRKFLFWETGYTAGEELNAANALLKVIRHQKPLSFIQPFEDILNQGELGKIYAILLPKIKYLIEPKSDDDFPVQPTPSNK